MVVIKCYKTIRIPLIKKKTNNLNSKLTKTENKTQNYGKDNMEI